MKKSTVSFLMATFVSLHLLSCGDKKERDNKLPQAGDTIAVKLAPVQNHSAGSTITATGLVSTENEARYAFKIGGVIERIAVAEGAFFKRGQLLASLRTTEINAQLAQAGLGYEKAKRDFSRAQNLYNDSVATLEQLQNARTSADIARRSVEAVAFNKKYAFIYAASDGFVTKKLANEGEVVNGGTPVFAINETSGAGSWVVKLGVSDKEWSAVQVGDKADVTIDAFGNKKLGGVVWRKSQAADMATGSFGVEIKLSPSREPLAVGMFGKATIYLQQQESATVIPYDALIEADGNTGYVFVPHGTSKVRKVPVRIAGFDQEKVLLKSGLEGIPHIIISNSAFLNEASTIAIIK